MNSLDSKNIGKIVKSDSHVIYKCRVYGRLESSEEISESDYKFSQFVKLKLDNDIRVIGVIYNSQLLMLPFGCFLCF